MDSSVSYLAPQFGAATLDQRAPVLIAASSEAAQRRAAATVEAAGYRSVSVPIEQALDRLALQAAASALWVEVDRDGGDALDRLLDRANSEAASGRMPAIVAAPGALIDPVVAKMADGTTQLLIDADEGERAAALAVATAWRRHGASMLNDVSSEPSSARLRQLSDEVGRIAATLARLSSGVGTSATVERPAPTSATGALPELSGETVRSVIRARRLRAKFLDPELFADPAWDMLLDLLAAEIAQHRVPVSSLCIAAAVPPTTALRWIKTMTDNGLFLRRADPHDGRRIFVELAPAASEAMRRYFAEVRPQVAV
ncbi:winged helix-turn-helix transcriptional regulator [Sphingomonas rhizophila]|uniref:Winged helix-turn-helix transcriptional regulator n=1 Tax=Sphingomonas rhizophila TaxID=2071607 RepID=A0A7G9S8J4_9SPHN|nr:MarR family winged helix-turn-helix transcriptional regulator [Sphingomonas rhizophila]QNN64169.1 winged helix-turn-helix transcriptional regulator [Sphingomonas rhizophila]